MMEWLRRTWWLGLGLLLACGAWASASANALPPAVLQANPSALLQPVSALQSNPILRRQEAFFARALQNRSVRGVPRPQGLRMLLTPDNQGRLPDSSVIDYLHWRRSLNPTRFDRHHPFIGPMLEDDRIVDIGNPVPPPDSPQAPLPPPVPPVDPTEPGFPDLPDDPGSPIGGGGTPVNPPPSNPQVPIPEPDGLLLWSVLALAGGGVFGWNRKRRGLRQIDR